METLEFSQFEDVNLATAVGTAIVEQAMDNVAGCSSARAVSWNLDIPYSTMENVLRKMLHFIPYKINLQSAVITYWTGEAINLYIDISG